MRLNVVLNSFGAPIILAVILFMRLGIGITPFRAFLESVFFVSIAISNLLSDHKYVQTLAIADGKIVITYFTKLLQVRSANFTTTDLAEVRLSKRVPIAAVWLPILRLKIDNQWIDFYVVSKKLYNEVQQYLTSANIEFMKQPLDCKC